MRLLNTKSLALEDFVFDTPVYAILSHTWFVSEQQLQWRLESDTTNIGEMGSSSSKMSQAEAAETRKASRRSAASVISPPNEDMHTFGLTPVVSINLRVPN
jgi:hypothetical protein